MKEDIDFTNEDLEQFRRCIDSAEEFLNEFDEEVLLRIEQEAEPIKLTSCIDTY